MNTDFPHLLIAGEAFDVTAASAFATDNRLIRSDGTGKGVQASGISVDDSGNISGITNVTGADANLVSGTAGANGRAAQWNADGDLVDAGFAASDIYRSGGTDVPVTDGGTGSSTASGAATNLGLGTGDSPQFTGIELGHATDTTLTRSAAGKVDVEGNTVLTDSEENQGPITGGANVTSKDLGTVTTGTTALDYGERPNQRYVNGGAHTLAPDTAEGSCILLITNNASAGAITTSGWTKVTGDAFDTTNGNDFKCFCSTDNSLSLLNVVAMQ